MSASEWSDESIAFAVEKWRAGLSNAQIAKEIGKVFSFKPTRNAVIGKLNRLGHKRGRPALSCKAPKVARSYVRPPRPPAGSSAGKAAVVHSSAYRKASAGEAEAVRAERLAVGRAALKAMAQADAVVSPNARPFLEAPLFDACKWPIGEGMTMLSCCNPVERGSYCEGHAAVAYTGAKGPALVNRATVFTRHERIDQGRARHGSIRSAFSASAWDEGREAA